MKNRKYFNKIIIDSFVILFLVRLFITDYIILIFLGVISYILFLVGFDLIKIISNFFNPNYYKLKNDLYRHSFTESILDKSFKLSSYEMQMVSKVRRKLENVVYFEYLNKNDSFDFVYKDFKKGITEREIINLVKAVLRQLKLKTKFVKISVYPIGESLKSPLGYFQESGKFGGIIGISINKNYDIKILLAIIIHECMHYFMHVYSIDFNEDNEYATDLIAVYLGFGKYMIEGYKTVSIIDNSYIVGFRNLTLGYLNEKQLSYVERIYHY